MKSDTEVPRMLVARITDQNTAGRNRSTRIWTIRVTANNTTKMPALTA